MMKTAEWHRQQAAICAEKANRASETSRRAGENAPGGFVTGRSGRTKAQNRATERGIDKTIKYAKIAVYWRKKAEMHERQAAYIDAAPERERRENAEKAAEKAARKAIKSAPLEDRLFSGCYPCGIVYADKGRDVNGDWQRLAFLPYKELTIQFEKDCPEKFKPLIQADADRMAAMRGQQYRIAGNTSITLGA